MPSALGVADATVADVGHPFDYAKQATLTISETDGSFKYAGSKANFEKRVNELSWEIDKTKGGCLLLFSSFADMKRVYEALAPDLRACGRTVLLQNDQINVRTNDELAAIFKEDGNAVLFGSESFATGFDVPGDALKLVSLWKLPYPGKDPVTEALMKRFYPRYKDLMLTRIVQGAGRLIRTETDRGHLHICDSRAEQIVSSKDLMVRHLGEFARG
jgi:ATP-dependent DNA helicase DinG